MDCAVPDRYSPLRHLKGELFPLYATCELEGRGPREWVLVLPSDLDALPTRYLHNLRITACDGRLVYPPAIPREDK